MSEKLSLVNSFACSLFLIALSTLLVLFSSKNEMLSEKGKFLCEGKSTAIIFNPAAKYSKYLIGEV